MVDEKISRLGDCEVCGNSAAKYTCPKCEVKTCCLDCVKVHKKELDCDGNRNKVKFVQMKKFSNLDLQSDYILLEETTRAVEKFAKHKLVRNARRYQGFQPYYATYNAKQKKQRNVAWNRNIFLKFLPNHFTRRKNNSLYYDQKKDVLFFMIEWIFPQAENFSQLTKRHADNEKLASMANQFLNEENCSKDIKEKLQFYHSAGLSGVTFLLKAESVPGEKFFELDHQESLRVNLRRKVVIEYPTIYVVLKDHKYCYEIIDSDEYYENWRGRNGASNAESNSRSDDYHENWRERNGASNAESNPDDVSILSENTVKSEIVGECSEHYDQPESSSSKGRYDANSRYLFLCGEIDSDSGYDNEEVEMENEDYHYQNGHHSFVNSAV